MNFKLFLESEDIVSLKAKIDAKKQGLEHQSHNIWKDKSGKEWKWNFATKRFEVVPEKKEDNEPPKTNTSKETPKLKMFSTPYEAEKQDLTFTGYSDQDKKKVSEMIDKMRKAYPGHKIAMAKNPHNPLSRGYDTRPYYRLYVDDFKVCKLLY